MHILGQFEVVDDPNRFVWIRAFPDGSKRGEHLRAFYTGDVWRATESLANTLMVEWDDVLLLRPDPHSPPFNPHHQPHDRRSSVNPTPKDSWVAAIMLTLDGPGVETSELRKRLVKLLREESELSELGWFLTAKVQNTFPRLPVRYDANLLMALVSGRRITSLRRFAQRAQTTLDGNADAIILKPTVRSTLR